MEAPESPLERAREVPVSFVRDDALVPKPKARIPTTDEHGRAPRNKSSRRIDFVDDGKLFEGHFTVQASNMKAIIQYLLDRHNEQDVVIQDLQKQVHMLRTRSLKSSRRGGGMEGSVLVPGRPTSSTNGTDLNKRLRSVEQFLQLWGVRLGEVADLVEEYGDPTITPDAYTSYLLDLPVFRLTRREARALMAAVAQPTASSVNAAAASDTATRRRLSVGKREGSSAPPQEERPRSVTPEKRSKKGAEGDDVVAAATLEKANAALEKAEMLLAELHNVAPRSVSQDPPLKPRRPEQPAKSSGGGAAVDAEARADIEELGEYVTQRFEELEARTAMALRSAASSSHAERPAPQQASGGGGAGKKSASAAAQSSPARGGGRAEEFVDSVAREDAATSLDLLEELEATMERRFKELNSAVANVAARAAALAKNSANSSSNNNNDSDKAPHRNQSPATGARSPAQSAVEESKKVKEQNAAAAAVAAAAREAADAAESRAAQAANSRNSSAAAKKNGSPSRRTLPDSNETSALIPVLSIAPAVLVDQAARDEAIALADRVSDLEEELLDRWQAMEERLRIIGRAAMKQGITNAAAGNTAAGPGISRAPMVDRKAREDAAMSLMRLQQVEKDLALLKRNAAAMPLHAGGTAMAEGTGAMALPVAMAPLEARPPLRDTYGSKVADLEREVEQRMAEVNQAIAQLRGTGGGGGGDAMPLALSPQKNGRGITLVAPVPFSHSPPQTASAAPPPSTSQLTLLSADTHSSVLPADAAPATSPEAEERRRAAQQQLQELGYNVGSDDNGRYSDSPRTSVKVGGRRTTISRLRSPDVPPFGSHLVQREVVDIPLMVERPAAGEGVEGTAATPVRAVRRVSNAKGDVAVSPDSHGHSRSPPHGPNAAGNAARVSVI